MKKITLSMFRNVYANIVIVMVVAIIACFSVAGYKINAFASSELFAIYNGDKSKNNVSLMINVYWGNEFIPEMLDTLKQNDVKCTFFVGGCWAAGNHDLLKKIYDDGHEIGNHGYYHKDHDKISYDRNKSEIDLCHKVVKSVIGYEMNLFAPPSGAYNQTTLECANSLGYKTIMWTHDTIDWRDQNSGLIISRATEKTENGSFILMHPTEKTMQSLQTIIDVLKAKGFNLTTVGNNLGL